MGLPSYYIGLGSATTGGASNRGVVQNIQRVSEKADDNVYSLSFLVEGVREDDIAVVAKDGQLVIELEKEYDPQKVAHTNWDKSYGIFTRYIDLPADADGSGLKKTVSGGVLTIEFARSGAPAKTSKKAPARSEKKPEATL